MEDSSKPTSRMGVLSWFFVLAFSGCGIWWFFYIPSVGKGGLLLAVGATLMPVFWEKVRVIGKMSWIAMLFVLLFAEYRAIDKDRADFAHDQSVARQEEIANFRAITDSLTLTVNEGKAAIEGLQRLIESNARIERNTAEFFGLIRETHRQVVAFAAGRSKPTSGEGWIRIANKLAISLRSFGDEWKAAHHDLVLRRDDLPYAYPYGSPEAKEGMAKLEAKIAQLDADYMKELYSLISDADSLRTSLLAQLPISSQIMEDKHQSEEFKRVKENPLPPRGVQECCPALLPMADYLEDLAKRISKDQ
jgi:hypothetical protein